MQQKQNKHSLTDRLGKEWLFFDGGMGSLLQARGLKPGELPETWNLTHPSEILDIHMQYLAAGSDVLTVNTFGANRLKYHDALPSITEAAVRIAAEARTRAGRPDALIALDIGPTGKMLEPMGDLSFEDAVSCFAEVVRTGAAAGADFILIETMSDSLETKAAVLAAKENSTLPVVATMVFDKNGKMLTGGTPESMTAMLEGLHADGLGINCSLGPEQMLPLAARLLRVSSLPVVINPNAGLPHIEDGKTVYDISSDAFAQWMEKIAALGVHALGGCCGTTPEYIRKTIARVRNIPFRPPVRKSLSVISSFSRTVCIGERPVLIGERINPTGKKRFKEALRNGDIDYILSEGLRQEENGADVLDVNTGLPGIDEVSMLTETVKKLQSVLALPLQIDTASIPAMERAMRCYNGKPLINSVNGKEESMRAVFPLVRKYGGTVVGLLLDENGIPADADGRIRIAERIYKTAAGYGIQKKDIVLDGLAMAVSSDCKAALVTLETIRRIHTELHGHSILGVSNISFGLPLRENINAAFFTMAMQNGLSLAIMNPNNAVMMAAFRSCLALTGQDPDFSSYIEAYRDEEMRRKNALPAASLPAAGIQRTDSVQPERTLHDCIEHGMDKQAACLAAQLLKTTDPLTLINEEMVPALDRAGKAFEQGTLFLPQLLMSAEAAKQAFAVVKEAMKGREKEIKGTILLATVKGDIHDIGKNIVKVLLENYGYEIADLGKDVPPETIVRTAKDRGIRLIGLSALMTTTVVSMEETIRLLRRDCPGAKIMVGGAVMTAEYAAQIGADYYAGDAMAAVRCADAFFSS